MDRATMKHVLLLSGALLLCTSLLLLQPAWSTGRALPEYAAQTGEPCSTCHVSPSGGGPRGPRGLAWVASGKTSTVPDLIQSLELLGVKLSTASSYYLAAGTPVSEAEAPRTSSVLGPSISRWLSQYDGN